MNQKSINFFELLNYNENGNTIDKIIIPKIQRDYVQGRIQVDETEVRSSFVSDLILTLQSGIEMELYFIYGKIEKTIDGSIFTPLDGQQRLTTLFLLYWYLSSTSNDLDKIRIKATEQLYKSRFSYDTRDYSKDFINYLVSYTLDDIKKDYKKEYEKKPTKEEEQWHLSDCIKDKNWFGFSWIVDPTVQAMLVMLDTFEERIPDNLRKEYLNNFGKIKFFFLNLEDFGMTDKLYVKMNDRGKKLSDFDYTKSTFSGDVFYITKDINESNKLWDGKFDNAWMDCFWKYCFYTQNEFDKNFNTNGLTEDEINKIIRKNTVTRVEKVYSNFINKILLLYLSEKNIRTLFTSKEEEQLYDKYYSSKTDCKPNIYDLTKLITSDKEFLHQPIRNGSFNNFYSFFNKIMECFFFTDMNNKILPITTLIEDYVTYPVGSDFDNILNNEKLQIDENLFLAAAIDFVLSKDYSAQDVYNEKNKQKSFKEWMLLCRNLILRENTFIDSQDVYINMNHCLYEWSVILGQNNWDLNNTISTLSLDFSFDNIKEQLEEEKEKYAVSKNNINLFDAIRVFENQRAYLGQIRFILEMSKKNEKFNESLFYDRVKQINSIISHQNDQYSIPLVNLLRQVLFCFGDWSLDYGSRKCFCQQNFHRDYSWKNFLRRETNYKYLHLMLEDWESNFKNQTFEKYAKQKIATTIKSKSIKDWRRFFIQNGAIFDFMSNSMMGIRYAPIQNYVLLRTSTYLTFNCNYGDLYTVSLYFSQYNVDEVNEKYTLSDCDPASYNSVQLTGKNKETITVKSYFEDQILKYDVINDNNTIFHAVDQTTTENYLQNILF